MKCRIHRGAREIGGNCVELESIGQRIVLDLGLPLSESTPSTLPDVPGFLSEDASLLGLVVSHPHPDHYGMIRALASPIPVYMCEVAARIITIGGFFTPLPDLGDVKPNTYRDNEPFDLGPFMITPLRMDHSAHGNHCLLIEADGKRLLYSGDLRAHGRQSHLFEDIVSNPPEDIEVLICEGTQVGHERDFDYPDEQSVQSRFSELIKEAPGIFLLWCSNQNIDRVLSALDASQENGRALIIDVYAAELLEAAGVNLSELLKNKKVRVYLPNHQKSKIKRTEAFDWVRPYYPFRVYKEELKERAEQFCMLFRPSMSDELRKIGLLDKATLVSSLWSGYVKKDSTFLPMANSEVRHYEHIHTSGHATVQELERFVGAFPKSRIVPIHTENPEEFETVFQNVEMRGDGEWWDI